MPLQPVPTCELQHELLDEMISYLNLQPVPTCELQL